MINLYLIILKQSFCCLNISHQLRDLDLALNLGCIFTSPQSNAYQALIHNPRVHEANKNNPQSTSGKKEK